MVFTGQIAHRPTQYVCPVGSEPLTPPDLTLRLLSTGLTTMRPRFHGTWTMPMITHPLTASQQAPSPHSGLSATKQIFQLLHTVDIRQGIHAVLVVLDACAEGEGACLQRATAELV